MNNYIVAYDLKDTDPSPYTTFLDEAEKRGWSRWIWGPKSDTWLHLPNTTLIGEFSNNTAAKNSFDDAVVATGAAIGRRVKVEKFALGIFNPIFFRSDVKADLDS